MTICCGIIFGINGVKSFRRAQGRSILAKTSPLKGDRRPVFLPYTMLSFPPRGGGRAFCARRTGLFLCRENSLESTFLSPRSAPLLFLPQKGRSPSFFLSEFLSSFLEHAVRRRALAFIPKGGATPKHRTAYIFQMESSFTVLYNFLYRSKILSYSAFCPSRGI